AQATGDAAAYFRERAGTDACQPLGATEDIDLFVVGQLGETAAALDAIAVSRHETFNNRLRKAELPTAIAQETAANQPLVPPAANGLCRYIELFAEFFQRQHRFGRCLRRQSRF